VPARLGTSHAGWRSLYLSEAGHGQRVLAGLFLASTGPVPGPGPRLARNPREEVLGFLQGWVKAWESCDVDRYIAFYSKQFKAYGMDYHRWRTYKAGLTKKYRSIDVEISDINITFKGGLALVSFNQKYWSDQYNDQGYKLMKLRQENGRWKIWREDWLPAQPMAARR
jgi:murein L,D-transpeptidase YafK